MIRQRFLRSCVGLVWLMMAGEGWAAEPAKKSWYLDTFFNIHLDHHVKPSKSELGSGSDPQHIVEILKLSRPDAVQYHSKGHPGWATYPTKVGQAPDNLKRDILRAWRDATNELGIPFTAYYSGGLDLRVVDEHPEWIRKKPDGQPQRDFFNSKRTSLCYNSPYVTRQVIPMIREIIADYDVDGFWFDGEVWSVLPCWCEYCKAGFKAETGKEPPPYDGNHPDWRRWAQFHRDSFTRYCKKLADVIHAAKPGCLFASNWAYTLRQPEEVPKWVDWLSGDFPPAHGLVTGAIEARFLASRGKPFDLMSWNQAYIFGKHYKHHPKMAAHLMQEAAMVISNGGRFFVWNNPRYGDGSLIRAEHEVIGQVRDFVYARKRWCHRTESVPDIAVLHSETHHYSMGSGFFDYAGVLNPVRGAHLALAESQQHFDIINEAALLERINEYRVLIVPERWKLGNGVAQAIENYVRNGGHLLYVGPLDSEYSPRILGLSPGQGNAMHNGFIPSSPYSFRTNRPVRKVVKGQEAEVLFEAWDQDEESRVKKRVPVAFLNRYGKGRAAYIAFDAFSEYHDHRYPLMRKFIIAVLDKLSPEARVSADAPPAVELTLHRKDGHLIVNLFNHAVSKDLESPNFYVEHIPKIQDIAVRVQADRRPKRVFLFPDPQKVKWEYAGNQITIHVRELHIHRAIVIEP